MWSKQYKRLGVALATSSLLALTAACGGDEGSSKDEFLIGGFGALTGPVAGWGEAQRNGAELAVEDINKSGDLDVELKMVYEDDACDPAGAQAVFRRLVDREAVDILM